MHGGVRGRRLVTASYSILHVLIIFFFAVHAPVSFGLLICQIEYIWKLLLDGSDAAWVFTADHIGDLLRQF